MVQQLSFLNIDKPGSLRAIQSIQEELESERMVSVLHTALKSFPCRFWERVIGTLTFIKHKIKAPGNDTGSGARYDIFGKRVGLWKVLLSDQAFKSSRKLVRSGM